MEGFIQLPAGYPLEVIRAATLDGAEALGLDKEIGSIEPGKMAEPGHRRREPLEDLKVLYGTGTIRVTPDNKVVRVGGAGYTVKDGIVYDAK